MRKSIFSKLAILIIGASYSFMVFADGLQKKEGWELEKNYSSAYFELLKQKHEQKNAAFDLLGMRLDTCNSNTSYDASKAIAKHNKNGKYIKPLIAVNVVNMLNTGIKQRYCYRNI